MVQLGQPSISGTSQAALHCADAIELRPKTKKRKSKTKVSAGAKRRAIADMVVMLENRDVRLRMRITIGS